MNEIATGSAKLATIGCSNDLRPSLSLWNLPPTGRKTLIWLLEFVLENVYDSTQSIKSLLFPSYFLDKSLCGIQMLASYCTIF